MVNSIKRNDFSAARVSISMLREDLKNKIRKGIINKNNEKFWVFRENYIDCPRKRRL